MKARPCCWVKDLTGNPWAEDKAELALGLPVLGKCSCSPSPVRVCCQSPGWSWILNQSCWGPVTAAESDKLGQSGQPWMLQLFSQGVPMTQFLLSVLCWLGSESRKHLPWALFTRIQKGILELCALKHFPGAWWFSEVMSVAIPLELKEKDPVDSWRVGFNFLFINVDNAGKKSGIL